jgi:hypothetical protein
MLVGKDRCVLPTDKFPGAVGLQGNNIFKVGEQDPFRCGHDSRRKKGITGHLLICVHQYQPRREKLEQAHGDFDGAALERAGEDLGVLLLHCCLAGEDLTTNIDEVCVIGVRVRIRYAVAGIPRCLFGGQQRL